MIARPLLALLAGLIAALLLGSPAAAGHDHHAGDVQVGQAEHDRPADKGCCTAEGAHCASPMGIVAGAAVSRPADEYVSVARPLDAAGPAARIPRPQPKPPRA
jgi:hypothetical protein